MITLAARRFAASVPLAAAFAALSPLVASCDQGSEHGTADAATAHPDVPGAASADARAAPDDGGTEDAGAVVTAPLPETVLGAVEGCWELEDREQWRITRTEEGGARVVRTLTERGGASKGDYAQRAAIPSALYYDASQAQLGFTTAGPIHGLLFVFMVAPRRLEGSWFSSHAPGAGYHATGRRATLRPCRSRASGAPPGSTARP
jgi:hypothetical protein